MGSLCNFSKNRENGSVYPYFGNLWLKKDTTHYHASNAFYPVQKSFTVSEIFCFKDRSKTENFQIAKIQCLLSCLIAFSHLFSFFLVFSHIISCFSCFLYIVEFSRLFSCFLICFRISRLFHVSSTIPFFSCVFSTFFMFSDMF